MNEKLALKVIEDAKAAVLTSWSAASEILDHASALIDDGLPESCFETAQKVLEVNASEARSESALSLCRTLYENLSHPDEEAISLWLPPSIDSPARMIGLPDQKTFVSDGWSLTAEVKADERAQLRVITQTPHSHTSLSAHLLMRIDLATSKEAHIALRFTHGADDEEIIVRFRAASTVVGSRHAHAQSFAGRYRLLSVSHVEGIVTVKIDGMPIYCRPTSRGVPDGIVLDVIGPPAGSASVSVGGFSLDAGHQKGQTDEVSKVRDWAARLCAEREDLDLGVKWLDALSGGRTPIARANAIALIDANGRQKRAYRSHLSGLCLQAAGEKDRDDLERLIDETAPQPSLNISDLSLDISSNPSRASLAHVLLGKREKQLRLLDQLNLSGFDGDTIGVIGKNGAGKSTFLKTLVGAMPISEGLIEIDAEPVLLRPGAGMQGELTGRENVLKTGLYLGMLPSEMNELLDDIIEFSELRDHIDRPFKYYSDGMRARLIFAMATAVPREILLLDELLSAGDLGFQKKAMERLDNFLKRAKLVIVVQHTFDFVLSPCSKCLLLDNGKPVYFGDPSIATELYREML